MIKSSGQNTKKGGHKDDDKKDGKDPPYKWELKVGFTAIKRNPSYGMGLGLLAMFLKTKFKERGVEGDDAHRRGISNAMKAEEKLLGFVALIITGASRFSYIVSQESRNHQNSIWAKTIAISQPTTLTDISIKYKMQGQVNPYL